MAKVWNTNTTKCWQGYGATGNFHSLLVGMQNYTATLEDIFRGVSIVAQWKWIWYPWGDTGLIPGLIQWALLWAVVQVADRLRSCVSVAVVEASSCSSDLSPSLRTFICHGSGQKKTKKKKKQKNILTVLRKLNILSPYDPAIALLGIYLGTVSLCPHINIRMDNCRALLIIAKTWKPPRGLSKGEWINKLSYIWNIIQHWKEMINEPWKEVKEA